MEIYNTHSFDMKNLDEAFLPSTIFQQNNAKDKTQLFLNRAWCDIIPINITITLGKQYSK